MSAADLDLVCTSCGGVPGGCGKTLRQRLEAVLPDARGDFALELSRELRGEDIPGTDYQHHHPFKPCVLCGESSLGWSEVPVCKACRSEQASYVEPLWLRVLRWIVE
jgi:hypothetical protein